MGGVPAHSLATGVLAPRPPTAKPALDERVHRDHPPVSSSPDSIRSEPAAPAAVSDTVVVESPTTKSTAPRNFKLKQSTLSWAKPSSSTAVEQPVGNNTSPLPSLVIDISEAIKAVYADALFNVCTKHAGVRGRCGRTGRGATDVQTQAFRKLAGTTKHRLAMEKQEALLNAASKQPRIDQHRVAVDAEKNRVVALPLSMLFVSSCDASMGTWVKLVQYLARKGVQGFPKKGYGTYYTSYGFGELTQALATWLQTTQLEHILTSPFIGICIDESTDRLRGKHMILYASFIHDSVLVTEFMQLITVEKADASSLLSILLSHLQSVGVDLQRISGISTDGARVMMGSKARLVVRLRQKIPHLVSVHCIAHRLALAAKDAAEELPVFDMVDDLIRTVADLLGRSGPRHARFIDLQEVITETSLEVRGIHSVWWLSRGDAVHRLVTVLPAVIVLLKELNSKMYKLASSCRFNFFLYFLADVLEQLNILNKTFQQKQIKRTTHHIESRYVDCGDDFGGGMSQWLSPFLERHGLGCSREVKVEGVDSDGRPSSITFTLHDEPVDSYSGPEDHDGCIKLCTEFAERIVANLEGRLGDLDSLFGVRLFTPDACPQSKSERNARCQEWLQSLVTMFKAQDREEILPGINKRQAGKELRLFCSVLARATKEERSFHNGLSAILKTPDWRESYPNLVQLWVAVAVIPLSTVECERGFTRQNVIKTWRRGGIKDARLGDLMCLSLMQYEPNYDEVVEIWRSYRKRKRE
ncbi:unnamed protein product [Closterium sp. NIES-54]